MLSIRKIGKADLPDLNGLYEELTGHKSNEAKLSSVFESLEYNDNYLLLGAFKGDTLTGSLMGVICQDLVGECKSFMVIENVVVASGFRRQGVGRALMQAIEREARERNCTYIIFVSGGQRAEAHKFYEQLGYREENVVGFRKHF
ncbi:phosphoglycolate phosphatase [Paenibacillus forsythiae]|uniref:Phosphoglycolate phosphatase n=1 Tax=Paenibacillus forsythiae TaxID=365616 RepID=A0ABU3H997_9BACL|nr:GNAT family N-acetyltransferase [Paenibacillus forsythiae]MDT3427407.1 phosphoglycolate phosphatase [Paenibacillus forsythiae]